MVCPFLEKLDARCGEHFSVNNLSDAFGHCFGRYRSCPVYQRLIDEPRPVRAGPTPPEPSRLAG